MDIQCKCSAYLITLPERIVGQFEPFTLELPCRRCSKVKAVVFISPVGVSTTYTKWLKKSALVNC